MKMPRRLSVLAGLAIGAALLLVSNISTGIGASFVATLLYKEKAFIDINAYTRLLAENDPVLAIAGTDPNTLLVRIGGLEAAMGTLAERQENADDKNDVRQLFPLSFLSSLAETENARKTFLNAPTPNNRGRYYDAIGQSLTAESRDLQNFTQAFERQAVGSSLRIGGLNGLLTIETMRAGLAAIEREHATRAGLAHSDIRCASGDIYACRLPRHFSDPGESTAQSSGIRTEIFSIWTEASASAPWKPVQLEKSVCLSSLPSPYFFDIWLRVSTDSIQGIRFADDIFLNDLSVNDGNILGHLRSDLGMSYTPVNSMKFYTCPEIGADRAVIRAMLATRTFAAHHAAVAPDSRGFVDDDILRENDARHYVAQALADTTLSPAERAEVSDIALMFSQHGGDIADLLADISRTLSRDAVLSETGVAFDLRAQTLFLTHSAFPSLFFLENTQALLEKSDAALETYLGKFVRYSDIRTQIPRSKIVSDLRSFLLFEGLINAPTSTPR